MPAELNARTRERILDGAMLAIARHGLAKLGMSDVSQQAGVSRGTLYRYFPSREELLLDLAAFETARFQQRVSEALAAAPADASRLEIALQQVTRYVGEHPAIRRVLETEPAFVLAYLRDQFPALRATTGQFLAPLLAETQPVRDGLASTEQLVDWMTRVMISAVLFPDPDPDGMARSLTAVYRLLVPAARPAPPARRAARKDRR
ncbi:MAG: helix-turn-helix domain-containing protein [Deltaproteobacteria bacterium]|nr:helix-turn-helix domain-containing protein [Deltaproteobacteria bacterium]